MSLTTSVELVGEHVILKPLDVTQAEALKRPFVMGNSIIFCIPVCQDLNNDC